MPDHEIGPRFEQEVRAQFVDPNERHQRAAYIDHPAQRLFEELAGPSARPDEQENVRILQQDAIKREAILRQTMCDWRAKAGALAREAEAKAAAVSEVDALREEVQALRSSLLRNV